MLWPLPRLLRIFLPSLYCKLTPFMSARLLGDQNEIRKSNKSYKWHSQLDENDLEKNTGGGGIFLRTQQEQPTRLPSCQESCRSSIAAGLRHVFSGSLSNRENNSAAVLWLMDHPSSEGASVFFKSPTAQDRCSGRSTEIFCRH